MKVKLILAAWSILYCSHVFSDQTLKCPDRIICAEEDQESSCFFEGGDAQFWKISPHEKIYRGSVSFDGARVAIRGSKYLPTWCIYQGFNSRSRLRIEIINEDYVVVPNSQHAENWRKHDEYYSCYSYWAANCLMTIK